MTQDRQLLLPERRIADWLTERAQTYRVAQERNPFSFHGTRAKLCEQLAAAILQGKYR